MSLKAKLTTQATTTDQALSLFAAHDRNGDGVLSPVTESWPVCVCTSGDVCVSCTSFVTQVDFQRLLDGLSPDISVSEVKELFCCLDADGDNVISKNEFLQFFRRARVDEQLDLEVLANAHERTRHALIKELARLNLELSNCSHEQTRAQSAGTEDAQTRAAIDAIWRIIEQCQIKEQVNDAHEPQNAMSLTSSAQTMFTAIDTRGRGVVSLEEVRRALQHIGPAFLLQAERLLEENHQSKEMIGLSAFELAIVPVLQVCCVCKREREKRERERERERERVCGNVRVIVPVPQVR